MITWFAHWMGLDNAGGGWYLWWSGIGADFSELALVGAALGVYRKHNCHVHKCPRIGRLPVEGTGYVVCSKHHPTGAPRTIEENKA